MWREGATPRGHIAGHQWRRWQGRKSCVFIPCGVDGCLSGLEKSAARCALRGIAMQYWCRTTARRGRLRCRGDECDFPTDAVQRLLVLTNFDCQRTRRLQFPFCYTTIPALAFSLRFFFHDRQYSVALVPTPLHYCEVRCYIKPLQYDSFHLPSLVITGLHSSAKHPS